MPHEERKRKFQTAREQDPRDDLNGGKVCVCAAILPAIPSSSVLIVNV